MKEISALSLFSGGLDSIVSCRLIMKQNIRVQAIRFVSPFFGYSLLAREKEYCEETKRKFGIDVKLVDISSRYIELLHDPPHGFGKNFNPCVDCKILLMSEARKMMADFNASFLISGEVVGQRPMSQRKDTLRLIERESGCDGLLVRPLCAKNLDPTRVEMEGLVDREKLLDFKGRSRNPQMELAKKFGIDEYPSPAGGCFLTDPVLGKRVRKYYQEQKEVRVSDLRLLLAGRHFRLPHGGMLSVGRREEENDEILKLLEPDDHILKMEGRPGPTAILRHSSHPDDISAAAGLVVRYGKKMPDGPSEAEVLITHQGVDTLLTVSPLSEEVYGKWMW